MGVISNGTTLLDAGALDSGIATGAMTLIKTITANNANVIQFVHGSSNVVLDNTYLIYVFEFINLHADSNDVGFSCNFSIDGGGNYNVTKTTTNIRAIHGEDAEGATLTYRGNADLAQGTGNQPIGESSSGGNNDANLCGRLVLFDPSNTTFVKHFTYDTSNVANGDDAEYVSCAGYCNTTSAVNAFAITVSSGSWDGIIKLYGIK